MFYTDLIDDAPITLTARQLRLAIQEAGLVSREQALNEAANLVSEVDTTRFAVTQLQHFADQTATEREELTRQIDASRGLVR